jgi:hypothetical protein
MCVSIVSTRSWIARALATSAASVGADAFFCAETVAATAAAAQAISTALVIHSLDFEVSWSI